MTTAVLTKSQEDAIKRIRVDDLLRDPGHAATSDARLVELSGTSAYLVKRRRCFLSSLGELTGAASADARYEPSDSVYARRTAGGRIRAADVVVGEVVSADDSGPAPPADDGVVRDDAGHPVPPHLVAVFERRASLVCPACGGRGVTRGTPCGACCGRGWLTRAECPHRR